MTYTKGPWRMNTRSNLPIYAGDAPNHTLVAVALKCEAQDANARLITTAPDLLEACKMALNGGVDYDLTWSEVCDTLRAAIEAAERKAT